jgi:chemotaxis methyl-accepting protein methylase
MSHVRAARGIDFSLYRHGTIERRTAGRMRLVGIDDYTAYLALLQRDQSEVDRLITHLTIKVGRFFRDPAVFALLREKVLPEIVKGRGYGRVRAWSAGCSLGEETYSLAMLLAEVDPAGARSYLVGTDVDDAALLQAREGCYRQDALVEMSPAVVASHFAVERRRLDTWYRLDPALRRRAHFQRHDLAAATEAPGHLAYNLILCRNVLIYFSPALQARVEHLLLRGLAPGGFLCLGEAEWPLPEVLRFLEVVDRQARIFRLKYQPGAV